MFEMKRPTATFTAVSKRNFKAFVRKGVAARTYKGFFFDWGGSKLTLANQGLMRPLGDPTQAQLQPKGKKQVGTGTATPKVIFQAHGRGVSRGNHCNRNSYGQAEKGDVHGDTLALPQRSQNLKQ